MAEPIKLLFFKMKRDPVLALFSLFLEGTVSPGEANSDSRDAKQAVVCGLLTFIHVRDRNLQVLGYLSS